MRMVGGSAASVTPSSSSRAGREPYSTPNPGEVADGARLPAALCGDRGREERLSVSEERSSPVMIGGGLRVSSESRMEVITAGLAGRDLMRCGERSCARRLSRSLDDA